MLWREVKYAYNWTKDFLANIHRNTGQQEAANNTVTQHRILSGICEVELAAQFLCISLHPCCEKWSELLTINPH